MKINKFVLVSAFVGAFAVALGLIGSQKPGVLILYSTSKAADNSRFLNRGVDEVLSQNRIPVNVSKFYMNLDLLPDPALAEIKANTAMQLVADKRPDVIVAFGNNGFDLIDEQLQKEYPDIKVVYADIRGVPGRHDYENTPNVMEVGNVIPLGIVTEFADIALHKKQVTVSVLGNENLENKSELEEVLRHAHPQLEIRSSLLSNDFGEWQTFIRDSAGKSDILLILPTSDLSESAKGSAVLKPVQYVPWIERQAKPLPIGMDRDFVRNGGAISFYHPEIDMGRMAMDLALSTISEGKKPRVLPNLMYTDKSEVAVDATRLEARGINAPRIYIEASKRIEQLYR